MLTVNLICVGKLKEKYLLAAVGEYTKRLGAFCRLVITEVAETAIPKEPSGAEITAALRSEYAKMEIPPRSAVCALCIEGKQLSSEELAIWLESLATSGVSQVTFIIGGSNGLSAELKSRADHRLSMSKMTFPHHLARVMLLEQIYRAYMINAGTRYHK